MIYKYSSKIFFMTVAIVTYEIGRANLTELFKIRLE